MSVTFNGCLLPNPGSPEAIALGCTCDRLLNNFGAGIKCCGMFLPTDNCQVHARPSNGSPGGYQRKTTGKTRQGRPAKTNSV